MQRNPLQTRHTTAQSWHTRSELVTLLAQPPRTSAKRKLPLRHPYKEAKLGVLQRGAWADMLLVNGDPTQDIDLLKDYERNLAVIIKDGKVWKNTISHAAA